jgi:hypothetical protein
VQARSTARMRRPRGSLGRAARTQSEAGLTASAVRHAVVVAALSQCSAGALCATHSIGPFPAAALTR